MRPGEYIQRSRIAAGVDRRDVVEMWRLLHLRLANNATPEGLIASIEDDLTRATAHELAALRLAFPFQPNSYRLLCAEADSLGRGYPSEAATPERIFL